MNFSFGADKRLKSQKKIERLFAEGKRIHKFPVRAVYYFEPEEDAGFQATVSVPKKLLKKASDRNLIKRRLREAFRLNQNQLKQPQKMEVMFVYTTSDLLDYQTIEKSMVALIDSLNSLSNDNTSKR